MGKFLSELETADVGNNMGRLLIPLVYYCDLLKFTIRVPEGFFTDFESIPRIPLIYDYLGHTSRRGGVIHDYLYRRDSVPKVTRSQADAVYREVSGFVGNNWVQRNLKWLGVRIAGNGSFHKHLVKYKPRKDCI